jgi:hypothetical protein
MYKWRETSNMNYYYRESDGRIMGASWHAALSTAFYSAKIYTETFPFTNDCEKYLGHYINEGAAKIAVEKFWLQQSNTLEYDENSNK